MYIARNVIMDRKKEVERVRASFIEIL